jgi:hypothetical protein
MYEVDELAALVPLAGEKEQRALMEDIRVNGQNEPAVLWQNRIVDGRCRQLACISLGIELTVKHLDSKLTRDEVATIVKSLNTRRNLTMTQKIISAVKEQERTNTTNAEIATAWAIGVATLKNGKYIARYRPDMIDVLFDGKSVKIEDPDKGYEVTTNKVNTLARIIKKQKEAGTITVDDSEVVEFSVDGALKTEVGKDWYYNTVNTLKIEDPLVRMLIVELANLKFKIGVDDA